MFTSALQAIAAACNAYAEWVRWQRETTIDQIENEIDNIASSYDDATAKLRIKRLLQQKQRHVKRLESI